MSGTSALILAMAAAAAESEASNGRGTAVDCSPRDAAGNAVNCSMCSCDEVEDQS
jgi:hypothetical protein